MTDNEIPQCEWIEHLYGKTLCRFSYFTCSNCGLLILVKRNPCPKCGAKMREADNDKT